MSNYPDIDTVVKQFPITYLDGGCHSVFSVDINGAKLVYKRILSQEARGLIKSALRAAELPVRTYFERKIQFFNHRRVSPKDESFDIESIILDAWHERGIPSIQILERQEKALIYKKLNAVNFDSVLSSRRHPNTQYEQLLGLICKIRSCAKSESNPLLFHPDMLPKNFLYSLETGETIAIDPGLRVVEQDIAELDAKINLVFVYALNKYDSGDGYIDGFVDTLDSPEKKLLLQLNKATPQDVVTYMRFRTMLVSFIKGKPIDNPLGGYMPSDTQHINSVLRRHV